MSVRLQTQLKSATNPSFTPIRTGLLQRKCACGGTPGLDGEYAECRKERLPLQRRSTTQAEPSTVAPIVNEVLRSPGQPLNADTQAFMGQRFGHNFGQVRVHTDTRAAESARAVNAVAYTAGYDIAFGMGQYAPQTARGRRLLAHELTHVVQQRHRTSSSQEESSLSQPEDFEEREADRIAQQVMSEENAGTISAVSTFTPLVYRQAPERTAPPAPATAPAATPSPIRTVKVWLNAFIPQTVPGKTEPAPAPHTGLTMLRGPVPGVSDCYLTDNRMFDANVHAPSRMHSEVEINVAGPTEVFQWHNCDETHEIDCEDGGAECTRKGDTSGMSFLNLRGSAASLIQVDLNAASSNPCQSGSPDIDYVGTFTINVGTRTVEFSGKIDEFPAFEGYATTNGGAGVTMFNTMPAAGRDPWNLPGGANRAQTGRAPI